MNEFAIFSHFVNNNETKQYDYRKFIQPMKSLERNTVCTDLIPAQSNLVTVIAYSERKMETTEYHKPPRAVTVSALLDTLKLFSVVFFAHLCIYIMVVSSTFVFCFCLWCKLCLSCLLVSALVLCQPMSFLFLSGTCRFLCTCCPSGCVFTMSVSVEQF